MRDLLLEIGCEELPARFIPGVLEQLKERARELLTESRITFGTVSSYGTPRRLALVVEDVAEKQADLEEEIKGPPARWPSMPTVPPPKQPSVCQEPGLAPRSWW